MDSLPLNQSLSHLKLSPKLYTFPSSFPSQQSLTLKPNHTNPTSFSFTLFATQNQEETQKKLPKNTNNNIKNFDNFNEDESYGEESKIIGSGAVSQGGSYGMEYLIEWKDGHAPSWVPCDYVAKDVIAEYKTPWWNAAKKADDSTLARLIAAEEDFCGVDAVDSVGRTTLLFVSRLGSAPCVKLLAKTGSNLDP